MPFQPKYSISAKIASCLMSMEANRQLVDNLPITPTVLQSLRETARLMSTHYSTAIEGNRLTQEEVTQIIVDKTNFPGRERDKKEVLAYHVALEKLEDYINSKSVIDEKVVQSLHALVMAGGRKRATPTPYRDGQNVIRHSGTNAIIYLPPEAKDVSTLMLELIDWINHSIKIGLPIPIIAAITHYQFATIHPYYDGNGRTARLITTLLLHIEGYGLKGIYCLEEYYAQNLTAYYKALTVGPSHNYYEGRAKASITKWIEYFCEGFAKSFEDIKEQTFKASGRGEKDKSKILRKLNPRQKKSLVLFKKTNYITSKEVSKLFNISERGARDILSTWVSVGFIKIIDPSKKTRRYSLSDDYLELID